MGSDQLQLPVIDFSDLHPGGDGWAAARAQAIAALESYGCFEAVFDRVTPELREALFDRAAPELFALPLETKKASGSSTVPYTGYIGQIPTMAYESLRIDGTDSLETVQGFTQLMWPQGNPAFCNTVWSYARQVQDLSQMVHRMVAEGLGIEKYYDSHIKSIKYALRLSEYGVPLDQETKIAMTAHLDPNMVTIICQHEVEGLEAQARDGKWIHVTPLPNSFTVVIGEAFKAWTNGRLRSPYHRVKIIENKKRYSALLGTRPSSMVQPPEELADEGHPLLFKPFNYEDYIKFRFSEEGRKFCDTLKAFCGVGNEVEA